MGSSQVSENVAVRSGQSADDLYRLYRPEWIIVHVVTADDNGDCAHLLERLREVFDERFHGRVRDEDVQYRCTGAGINAVAQLLLRLPTLKGEFKYVHLAERHADEQGFDEHTIVARNSKADHDLRQYATRKLPQ
jgi:hypothetical protein